MDSLKLRGVFSQEGAVTNSIDFCQKTCINELEIKGFYIVKG